VHLVIPDATLHDAALAAAKKLLHDRFQIDHTTIQIERVGPASPCQK
jgi:Co/Zn/Cd efflux system component